MPEGIELKEYDRSDPVRLTTADLAQLDAVPSDRLYAVPTTVPGHFTLRSGSWVGVVDLDQVRVWIGPKVDDLGNVLMMLASVAGVADWSPRLGGYARHDLVEGIAELVLRTADQATRRGLLNGYQEREERIPVLRGRLDMGELAARPWEQWPLPCRYEDFTADVAENRILRATVTAIRRWVVTPAVRRLAAELEGGFEEVSAAPAPLLEFDLVRESPLNEHYRPALALARIVLEGLGVAHGPGSIEATAFLVDMNHLYESWIGAELTTRLWPALRVAEQHTVALSRRPPVPMKPDLVFLAHDQKVLVGDVKYKLTGTGLARNADYYQLVAYATALRLPRGILIYCQADEAPDTQITVEGGGQSLTCYPLSLAGSWVEVTASLDRLATAIKRLADQ